MRQPAQPADFATRHLGADSEAIAGMLKAIGQNSLEDLMQAAIPEEILDAAPLPLPPALDEAGMLRELHMIARENHVWRSLIGMGYHGTHTPAVIRRCILENPGWYTQYTPYQAEISQGRLEALLNFQTMICDLTGLEIANASLLDEGTAAAEAMAMAFALKGSPDRRTLLLAGSIHPQTVAVLETRAEPLGIHLALATRPAEAERDDAFGLLLQYPESDGAIQPPAPWVEAIHRAGGLAIAACDPLALTLLQPPGEFGADIAVGSTQRFGVPLGYGGPHAAYLATRHDFRRHLPGRLVGVSRDADGNPALRLTLQTREQHIRRDRATSNICTAQVLLAVMASMYAVHHGPEGLLRIANRIRSFTTVLRDQISSHGLDTGEAPHFDTLRIRAGRDEADRIVTAAAERRINLRRLDSDSLGVTLDECTTEDEIRTLVELFCGGQPIPEDAWRHARGHSLPDKLRRTSAFLTHPVFHRHRTETELLRYIKRLESKDLSLTTSMIPLGSCTMKLNAAAEMLPVTWPEFGQLHPFCPPEQARGYRTLFDQLEAWLAAITGLPAVSLQPNAGSQGEYTGLMVIRAWHENRGQGHRDVCLIPLSAHGTNPASAVMAGFKVVPVACDAAGNIDPQDLEKKAAAHADHLAALMVTYPSTHGVFEKGIRQICDTIHRHGGQVYLDGANLNAQVGWTNPGAVGADVCHLNLHKTFCIPHGGGGPGMGPIAAAGHLAPFLPGHPIIPTGGTEAIGPISAAPWGSPSILVISWAYLRMMGSEGLVRATALAVLNANYMAKRLHQRIPVLYRGPGGLVAHEFILDLRPWKAAAGIEAEDVAKRLMDYGFHAPTMSWPVPGTLMIEPTESESVAELDRFCDAMLAIADEVEAIGEGRFDRRDNPLKNAPHTAAALSVEDWSHPYTRETAVFPAPWLKEHKFWPPVRRIDNVHGDRNPICSCPPMEALAET
ncbi:MAG: glycine dehydrogenase (aminomethyl-transferring) [Puniceicoccaceae bacterium]|nr:MAG: glycine dehydrogenase (aminomethyl-transferring) [Puniceicoccaceae bacterium]